MRIGGVAALVVLAVALIANLKEALEKKKRKMLDVLDLGLED